MKSKTQLLQEKKIQEFRKKFACDEFEDEFCEVKHTLSEACDWLSSAFKEIESEKNEEIIFITKVFEKKMDKLQELLDKLKGETHESEE